MATIDMTAEDLKKKQGASAVGAISAQTTTPAPVMPPEATGIATGAFPSTTQALRDTNASIAAAREKGNYGAMIGQSLRGVVPAGIGLLNDTARSAAHVLNPAANALKTMVTGSDEPATPVNPSVILPNKPAAPATVQTATAAPTVAAPAVQPDVHQSSAQPAQMPKSIGDLAPGTGMVRNNSTGKMTPVGQGGDQRAGSGGQPQGISAPSVAMPQVPQTPNLAQMAAEKATTDQIGLHNKMMAKEGGGIGAGLVARGAMNKSKNFSGIAAEQSAAETAKQNAETAAQEAQSRDAGRQAQQKEVQRKAAQEQKVNDLREQYAAHDDKTDPDGAQRRAFKSKIEALTGVDRDKYQPVYTMDPLTGQKTPSGGFDARSGKYVDMAGNPVQAQQSTVPAGMKQVGTSNGIPVYEDDKGKQFTQ